MQKVLRGHFFRLRFPGESPMLDKYGNIIPVKEIYSSGVTSTPPQMVGSKETLLKTKNRANPSLPIPTLSICLHSLFITFF